MLLHASFARAAHSLMVNSLTVNSLMVGDMSSIVYKLVK